VKQLIFQRAITTPGASNWAPFPGAQTRVSSFEVQSETPWAVDGTFRNLRVVFGTAPGSGKSWQLVVRKNAVDTAMTVTISDLNTVGLSSGEFTVAAGDYLSLRWLATNTPAQPAFMKSSIEFEGTTAKYSGYTHPPADLPTSGTRTTGVFTNAYQGSSIDVWNATYSASQIQQVCPTSGTIRRMQFRCNGSPGGGTKGWEVVLYKNSVKQDGSGGTVDTRVTCSATSQDASATFALTVAAGDLVYAECTALNTPAARMGSIAIAFEADTDGESILCGWTQGNVAGTVGIQYVLGHGEDSGADPTEADVDLYGNPTAFSLSRLYVKTPIAAPGSGKSWTITLRKNSATPTSPLSVTIADAAQSGNDTTHSTTYSAATDTFDLMLTATSSPIASAFGWSMVLAPVAPTVTGTSIFGEDGTVAGLSRVHLLNLDGVTRTLSDTDYEGSAVLGGNLTLIEQASPPAAIANAARIWAEDNGSGKTRVMIQFGTGAAIQLSIEV
jgi:hypothetical protein